MAMQAQDIRAGLIAGVNLSQIDGDNLAGYNKIGLNLGGTAHWFFNENVSLNFEILYTQKGSSSSPRDGIVTIPVKFKLDYVEVPVLFNYHDRGKVSFGGGLAYGRLVRNRIEIAGSPVKSVFKNDFSGILNGTVNLKEQLALNIRYQYSLVSIGGFQQSNMYNHFFSIRLIYMFRNL